MSIIGAWTFCIAGFYILIMNWGCFFSPLFARKRSSMVPPLGGLLVMIGLSLHPAFHHLAWIGLPLDCGFWALPFVIYPLIKHAALTSQSKFVMQLSGRFEDVAVNIKLYRPDYYVATMDRTLPAGTAGWCRASSPGTWSENSGRLTLVSHRNTAETPSKLVLQAAGNQYEVVDSCYGKRECASEYQTREFPPVACFLQVSRS